MAFRKMVGKVHRAFLNGVLRRGNRRREERFTAATVRANQTRRGALPAQIFHSYGQINHDLSAGCTAVWGIERINDAMFGIEHTFVFLTGSL